MDLTKFRKLTFSLAIGSFFGLWLEAFKPVLEKQLNIYVLIMLFLVILPLGFFAYNWRFFYKKLINNKHLYDRVARIVFIGLPIGVISGYPTNGASSISITLAILFYISVAVDSIIVILINKREFGS